METYLGENGYVTRTLSGIIMEIKNGYDKISSSLNNGDPSNSIGKGDEYYNSKETVTPPSTELPNVTIGHIMNTHLSGAGSFGKYNVRF